MDMRITVLKAGTGPAGWKLGDFCRRYSADHGQTMSFLAGLKKAGVLAQAVHISGDVEPLKSLVGTGIKFGTLGYAGAGRDLAELAEYFRAFPSLKLGVLGDPGYFAERAHCLTGETFYYTPREMARAVKSAFPETQDLDLSDPNGKGITGVKVFCDSIPRWVIFRRCRGGSPLLGSIPRSGPVLSLMKVPGVGGDLGLDPVYIRSIGEELNPGDMVVAQGIALNIQALRETGLELFAISEWALLGSQTVTNPHLPAGTLDLADQYRWCLFRKKDTA